MRIPVWVSAIGVAGCVGDVDFGNARFACERDPDCGSGARCVDGLCVVGLPPDVVAEPTGFACTTPLIGALSGGEASFRVDIVNGRQVLVVSYDDGLEAEVPLPPEVVVDLDAPIGPLEACCENPCCPPSSQ